MAYRLSSVKHDSQPDWRYFSPEAGMVEKVAIRAWSIPRSEILLVPSFESFVEPR
jgi:hypothetical protein